VSNAGAYSSTYASTHSSTHGNSDSSAYSSAHRSTDCFTNSFTNSFSNRRPYCSADAGTDVRSGRLRLGQLVRLLELLVDLWWWAHVAKSND
jgi:hypothetical protein